MGKGAGGARVNAPRRNPAPARSGPNLMAGRLFASSASPHRGPDSAVLSPKQRTPRLFPHVHIIYMVSRGPALGCLVR